MNHRHDGQPDWSILVFDPVFISSIERLAVRRFDAGALAEEAATYTIEFLSADDWSKCRQFQGKSKPTTFLYTLCNNAIEEFARKRFGRPRPPRWLSDMGELWVRLWRSLCLERQLLPSVLDRLTQNNLRERSEVAQAAKVIKARLPNCGEVIMDSLGVDDIDSVSDAVQDQSTGHSDNKDTLDQPRYQDLLRMVRATIDPDVCCSSFNNDTDCDNAASHTCMTTLREKLRLNDQERLLLRLIYAEGLSKTAASRALGLQDHQAGRIVNNALERIAAVISESELDLDTALALV